MYIFCSIKVVLQFILLRADYFSSFHISTFLEILQSVFQFINSVLQNLKFKFGLVFAWNNVTKQVVLIFCNLLDSACRSGRGLDGEACA